MTSRGAGLAVALALVAGCASPPHPVQLSTQDAPHADRALATQASAFESFMRKARGIEPGFSGPSQVASAMTAGAAYEPKQLEAGLIAYAAMAALQEPRFAQAARAGGDELSRRLAADPRAVLSLPGADAAAARAAGALLSQGSDLAGEGQKVKKASYTVQHQAWSKGQANRAQRLAEVKRTSAAGYRPSQRDTAELFASLGESGKKGGSASPVVVRALAVAALSARGEPNRGRALMNDERTGSCLRIAKLNYHQCVASAGPQYEDIYCLGQHAMIDPGQCVVEATRTRTTARR